MLHEKGLKLGEFEVSNSHKIGKFESFVYFFHSKCTSDSMFWEKQDRDFFMTVFFEIFASNHIGTKISLDCGMCHTVNNN